MKADPMIPGDIFGPVGTLVLNAGAVAVQVAVQR